MRLVPPSRDAECLSPPIFFALVPGLSWLEYSGNPARAGHTPEFESSSGQLCPVTLHLRVSASFFSKYRGGLSPPPTHAGFHYSQFPTLLHPGCGAEAESRIPAPSTAFVLWTSGVGCGPRDSQVGGWEENGMGVVIRPAAALATWGTQGWDRHP